MPLQGNSSPFHLCPETKNCLSLLCQQPQTNGISINFLCSPVTRSSSRKMRRQRSFSAECNRIVCRRRQFNATMASIKIGGSFIFPEFHANELPLWSSSHVILLLHSLKTFANLGTVWDKQRWIGPAKKGCALIWCVLSCLVCQLVLKRVSVLLLHRKHAT